MTIIKLENGCRELEFVELYGCDKVTDDSVHRLEEYRLHLKDVENGTVFIVTLIEEK